MQGTLFEKVGLNAEPYQAVFFIVSVCRFDAACSSLFIGPGGA
jgi:hypothetical protein